MRECWVRATKYGVALFPKRMKAGRKSGQETITFARAYITHVI